MPSKTNQETPIVTILKAINSLLPQPKVTKLPSTRNDRRRAENLKAMNTPFSSDYEKTKAFKPVRKPRVVKAQPVTPLTRRDVAYLAFGVGVLAGAVLMGFGMVVQAMMDVRAI